MSENNKPKAVWTHVEDTTKGDQRFSFYMSEKGAIKLTRHTPAGEVMVFCVMGPEFENIVKVSEELPRIQQAFQDALPTIQANKERIKAQTALEREKQKAVTLQVRKIQAAKDAESLAILELERLTGKKLA